MESIKRIHFWYGVLGIIAFLLTGQYMFHYLGQLQGMDDGPRMLYRSAHIYLLLASMINLATGVYLEPKTIRQGVVIQYVLSVLLLISPLLILSGFFLESQQQDLSRPLSRIGLYCLFAAAVLLLVLAVKKRFETK